MGYSLSKVATTIRDVEIVVRINSEKEPDSRAKARFDIISKIVANAFNPKRNKKKLEEETKIVNTIV